MMRTDRTPEIADPKAKVDRILNDLLGQEFDLLSDDGRDAALEAIGKKSPDTDDAAKDEDQSAEIPEKNTLSSWQAARSLCASLQINAAIARLDKLEPLPDEGEDLFSGTVPDDFATARRQVREQLLSLQDEFAEDNDTEVIENIFKTLFGGDDPLFDQLRESGNYIPGRINDRDEEKHVIHYVAIRALSAMLCQFGLDCKSPTKEPDGHSSIGADLTQTERALVCARDIGGQLVEELAGLGLSSECTTDTIPGLEFETGEAEEADPPGSSGKKSKTRSTSYAEKDEMPPKARDLFALLDRVAGAANGWIAALEKDGRRGAHLIRSEVDRLAAKAQRFRPKPPPDGKQWSSLARLTDHFVEEMDRAARGIGRLLES